MTDDAGRLERAMKRVAVTLKQADIPFALAGGYAAYARGGPQPGHDVDFYLRESDVARAEHALFEVGLRVEHPPEDWLVKVFADGAMVDLIFRPAGLTVTAGVLDRATEVEVDAVCMPVLSATDLLTSKLAALDERYCNFSSLFPVVRALREQLSWGELRQRTRDNPFAQAFLSLCEQLSIGPSG